MRKTLRQSLYGAMVELERYVGSMELNPALVELIKIKGSKKYNSASTTKKTLSNKIISRPELYDLPTYKESPMFI